MQRVLREIHRDEDGHLAPTLSVLAAIGAIVLTIGVVGDRDVVAWVGGVLLALGVLAPVISHPLVEYGIFARLETLERGEMTDE